MFAVQADRGESMAKKKKAASAGAGALAAGKAARDNEYVQRLVEDEDLRDNLRTAYESARKAYGRISNGKGPAKAILDDKKTQKELREAAHAMRDAADSLRGAKKKRKRRRGGRLLIVLIGVGAALALSEGLRKKVLDALFGAEEEFEYSSTTTSAGAGASQPTPAAT
jgi:adenylosuccinate synthase